MNTDPIAADIVRCCTDAGLRVDTVDKLPTHLSTVYIACIFPPDMPQKDSSIVHRVALQQKGQYRYWIRPASAWQEELDQLAFEVADSDEWEAPY